MIPYVNSFQGIRFFSFSLVNYLLNYLPVIFSAFYNLPFAQKEIEKLYKLLNLLLLLYRALTPSWSRTLSNN